MSKKRILITGAGSGFGEGAAIGLARNGHDVIAGVQIWPQVTSLRRKVKSLGLSNLRVEKLDLLHPYDVANALKWDIVVIAPKEVTAIKKPGDIRGMTVIAFGVGCSYRRTLEEWLALRSCARAAGNNAKGRVRSRCSSKTSIVRHQLSR
jgi:hypothetical protein